MKRTERAGDRRRIDLLLVERGLAPSREKAQAFILAGLVSAAGRPVAKPGTIVPVDAELRVTPTKRFVSRGGDKLEGALDAMALDVAGAEVLDVGASTGGFTDCLLQRGARRVVALDVGRGQLDWSLRNDPRVVVVEGVNVRYLKPEGLGSFDLIVVDVSFISLRLVIPAIAPLLRARTPETIIRAASEAVSSSPEDVGISRTAADAMSLPPEIEGIIPAGSADVSSQAPVPAPLPALLVLVKPQFELGRGSVGRGGIVREPAKHLEAILKVVRESTDDQAPLSGRLGVRAIVESPIRGAEGNREFFVLLSPGHERSMESIEEEARRVAILPTESTP